MRCREGTRNSPHSNMTATGCVKYSLLLIWKLSGSLTLPEDSFLGPDVRLQLCGSDVDADRLRQVADGLGHHGFGCVAGLEPGCLQPHILTLVGKEKCNRKLRTNFPPTVTQLHNRGVPIRYSKRTSTGLHRPAYKISDISTFQGLLIYFLFILFNCRICLCLS